MIKKPYRTIYKFSEENIPMLDRTNPDIMSSSSIPDNLTRTFSPGPASLTLFSSQYTAKTFT